MGKLDDVDEDPYFDLVRRVEKLERAAPTGFSSVTRGTFRIASMEGLKVEGSERVTGILIVDGTLQVTGTETVSGTLVISGGQIINGTFVINGTTTVNGATTFVGDVHITGTATLTGTLAVTGGGQVQIGLMVLSPALSGGGGGISSPVDITVSTPKLDVAGALTVDQTVVLSNLPPKFGTGLLPGLLWIDGSGVVYQIIS